MLAVTVIRMIKMFAWEERTANRIDATRQDELKKIIKFKMAQVFSANVQYVSWSRLIVLC